jgi:stage V sporulation protein SpoVS
VAGVAEAPAAEVVAAGPAAVVAAVEAAAVADARKGGNHAGKNLKRDGPFGDAAGRES